MLPLHFSHLIQLLDFSRMMLPCQQGSECPVPLGADLLRHVVSTHARASDGPIVGFSSSKTFVLPKKVARTQKQHGDSDCRSEGDLFGLAGHDSGISVRHSRLSSRSPLISSHIGDLSRANRVLRIRDSFFSAVSRSFDVTSASRPRKKVALVTCCQTCRMLAAKSQLDQRRLGGWFSRADLTALRILRML